MSFNARCSINSSRLLVVESGPLEAWIGLDVPKNSKRLWLEVTLLCSPVHCTSRDTSPWEVTWPSVSPLSHGPCTLCLMCGHLGLITFPLPENLKSTCPTPTLLMEQPLIFARNQKASNTPKPCPLSWTQHWLQLPIRVHQVIFSLEWNFTFTTLPFRAGIVHAPSGTWNINCYLPWSPSRRWITLRGPCTPLLSLHTSTCL